MEGISAETLWAAHKATIRGKLIQMSSQRKKEKIAEIEKLERDFTGLCKQHKRDPSKVQIAQLDAARIALNLAHTVGAERSLKWNNAKFYFQRDKMSTLLARKLSPKFSSYTLPKIRLQDGSTTLNPPKILQAFQSFYSKLYQKNDSMEESSIKSFLDDLNIPTLSKDHVELMETPFSTEETLDVIKKLKGGSAPSPDGFSNQYYKTFADTVSTPYYKIFQLQKGRGTIRIPTKYGFHLSHPQTRQGPIFS